MIQWFVLSVATVVAFDHEEIMFRPKQQSKSVAKPTLKYYQNAKDYIQKEYNSKDMFKTLVIGAHDGTHNDNLHHSMKKVKDQGHWFGYFVEPVKNNFEKLISHYNFGHREEKGIWHMNAHNFLQAAVSKKERIALNHTCTFYSVSDKAPDNIPPWVRTQIAKLDKERMIHRLKSFGILEYLEVTHIPCYTYDELIERMSLKNVELDHLQIDVEGFDYEILEMVVKTKYKLPRSILYESKIIKRWKLDIEAEKILTEVGYLVQKEGENTFAYKI